MREKVSKVIFALSIGALVGGVLGGVALAAEQNEKSQRHEILSRAHISLPQAMQTAQSESGGGFAVSGELREKQGMYYYEIDVVDSKSNLQVYINPANGLVVGKNVKRSLVPFVRSQNQPLLSAISSSQMSFHEAVGIALTRVAGIVREVNFNETLLGKYVYRIGVIIDGKEHEIIVDPDSGEIVDVPR